MIESRKEWRLTGGFKATDSAGRVHIVDERREFHITTMLDNSIQESPGVKRYSLRANGHPLYPDDDGAFTDPKTSETYKRK